MILYQFVIYVILIVMLEFSVLFLMIEMIMKIEISDMVFSKLFNQKQIPMKIEFTLTLLEKVVCGFVIKMVMYLMVLIFHLHLFQVMVSNKILINY